MIGERAQRTVDLVAITGEIFSLEPMSDARAGHAMVLLESGDVLALGGYSTNFLSTVERLDLSRGRWTPMPSLPSARGEFVAVPVSGGLLLVGGRNQAGLLPTATYSIEAFSAMP
jgi:N-acetylneuraminic acid mutarotase